MRKFTPTPEYVIPLNDEQLKELGLFCAVWSQIDTLITFIMSGLSGAPGWGIDIMTGQATTSPRVNMLARLAKIEPDTPTKTKVRKLCEEMGGLLNARNHLMHGLWAIYWAPNGDTEAASQYNRSEKPIMAAKIASWTDKAARFSHELGLIAEELDARLKSGSRPRVIYVGPGDPNEKKPPKPLPVLSARVRVDRLRARPRKAKRRSPRESSGR